jgi:hypothetical protein
MKRKRRGPEITEVFVNKISRYHVKNGLCAAGLPASYGALTLKNSVPLKNQT